jgi:hypothetical protein
VNATVVPRPVLADADGIVAGGDAIGGVHHDAGDSRLIFSDQDMFHGFDRSPDARAGSSAGLNSRNSSAKMKNNGKIGNQPLSRFGVFWLQRN